MKYNILQPKALAPMFLEESIWPSWDHDIKFFIFKSYMCSFQLILFLICNSTNMPLISCRTLYSVRSLDGISSLTCKIIVPLFEEWSHLFVLEKPLINLTSYWKILILFYLSTFRWGRSDVHALEKLSSFKFPEANFESSEAFSNKIPEYPVFPQKNFNKFNRITS